MARIFLFIYNWSEQHRIIFYSIVAGLVLLSAGLAFRLDFDEDISKMIPADEAAKRLNDVLQNTRFTDRLVLNISLTDTQAQSGPDMLVSFAEKLVDSLEVLQPAYIQEISRVSGDMVNELHGFFYQNLPVFLQPEDYHQLERYLSAESVDTSLRSRYKSLVSPAGLVMKDFILKDPLNLTQIALDKLQELQVDNNYVTRDGFLLTKDHRNLLLFINPSNPPNETSHNGYLLKELDRVITSLHNETGERVSAEYFGGAAVAVGNAGRLKQDIMLTVTIALVLLFLLFSLFYRRLSVFFLVFMPAAFGALVALACLYLLTGRVSMIALGVGSILIGITIDYPLHIFTHYRKTGSIRDIFNDLTLPILTSCLTTAMAFFCLVFVQSEALNNLGIFVGISILGSAFFSLTVLPHLLRTSKFKRDSYLPVIEKLSKLEYEKIWPLWIVVLTVSGVCLFTFGKVTFESDLSAMNYVPAKLAKAEANLDKINKYTLKSIFLISSGQSLDEAVARSEEALENVKDLKRQGVVQQFAGVNSVLISKSRQEQRIEYWNTYWTEDKKQALKNALIETGRKYGFKEKAFTPFYELLDKEFVPVPLSAFDLIRKNFMKDFVMEKVNVHTVVTVLKVEESKKQNVYDAFSQSDGLIVFDRQLLTTRFMDVLKYDFDLLLKLSVLLVFIILVHAFGRLELGLFAFIPLVISWVWTLGLMGLFGMQLNMFNMIISTFIFGLGIDYSIFMSRGYLQDYKLGLKNLSSYKTSILLSVLTTLIGIGVLIFAKHPALQSIALVSIIGILSVVTVTFTVQPVLLKLFLLARKKKRTFPVTLVIFIKTMITWGLLLIGCLVIILFGMLVFTIFPFSQSKRKALFHTFFMYASRLYIMITFPFGRTTINEGHEDFKKPAVIICNHQSLIETPLIVMMAPRLIILTNDWVRNSPHFGPIARFGDFYSVSAGIDEILDKLQDRVNEGYSIVVFPEGTRSESMKIQRFHKGAFYLAEKLNLEILPVLFHGTGDFLRKNDFWGRPNTLAVKILKRINPDDSTYGETYTQKAKGIKKLMVEEYSDLQKKFETPEYNRRELVANYIYKGPVLEWYLKVKLYLERNFEVYHRLLPEKGSITDIGCGYGYISYMLSLMSGYRRITGIDYDHEKISVANECYLKNEKINFVCADITEYPFEPQDAFILSDVLHYLSGDQQTMVLQKCLDNLKEGGVILLRDANADMPTRTFGTKLTEWISTGTGFNKADNSLEYLSVKQVTALVESQGFKVEAIDNTKFTSNIFMLIKKQDL